MIKAIVVEDEWYNLEEINELVNKTGFMTVVGKYQNPVNALNEISETCPEVAFIDIEMPEMDGVTLAEKLLEKDPSIIIAFITSWNQYAVKAFELNALDYILKPIKIERFNQMVRKIQNQIILRRPLKASALKIKCFDRLEVSIDGVAIKWERAKAEELFAFLLMHHKRYIHKDTIIENLWSEYEPKKALQILQTSMCKIRNVFSEMKEEVELDYSNGKYRLIIKNCKCDYIEFQEVLSNYKAGNRNTYTEIGKISEMFGDGFLVKQGYLWSYEKDQELRKKIILILKEIISEQWEEDEFKELAIFLKRLSILEPYNEEVNYRLFYVLNKLKSYNEISSHFKWLKKTLKNEFNLTPSKRIEEIVHEA